ncbi:putative protease YdcP [Arsenophonus endosymbiont of Aleurodicus dispersus]|uniref:prephenate-dependent tRNA uridine(34) hydroxylase TrhP n=1 Tax=Arsenophonus endosymbiont of Aleurodicus dispersus TaxID=235559 RepID=UPI000EB0D3C6|nr:tRNA 5-hydroxyuridine modification protein YegQ [Arsenophonus endosymbiont of Aleurodicus dispersus]VAY02311.1 putative protease YdcP [Arsenophonus endosymbiont of Aleurodicus dispersus]
MFKPELLSPAGSLKNMRYAFAYGADAVYAGQPRYSLRVRNNEFNHENLAKGIKEAHAMGKLFYVVVNIVPHNAKLKTFIRDLTPVIEMQPDALIISDPGLIMLVMERFPTIDIHLSVQANAVNWATVKFWQQIGLSRIILSRELSIEEIAEIRQQVPNIELEIFVHGALCMAYSGRCLLSSYINKRDSNQGTCTNACRWEYKLQEGREDLIGNVVHYNNQIKMKNIQPSVGSGHPTDKVFLMKEIKHNSEYMTTFEDEHGTYIMNSKDLRAIEHVERLIKIGVNSFKIEGRTKSFYYCARTAQVYRLAIEDSVAGKPFNPILLTALEGLANRGYTEGFLRRHNHDAYQTYEYGYSVSDSQQFVGKFTGQRKDGLAEVEVKNKFSIGDNLELMTPAGNIQFTLTDLFNKKFLPIQVAPGNGYKVYLPIHEEIELQFALLIRNLAGTTTRKSNIK